MRVWRINTTLAHRHGRAALPRRLLACPGAGCGNKTVLSWLKKVLSQVRYVPGQIKSVLPSASDVPGLVIAATRKNEVVP